MLYTIWLLELRDLIKTTYKWNTCQYRGDKCLLSIGKLWYKA